jgi:hypothetical protein
LLAVDCDGRENYCFVYLNYFVHIFGFKNQFGSVVMAAGRWRGRLDIFCGFFRYAFLVFS